MPLPPFEHCFLSLSPSPQLPNSCSPGQQAVVSPGGFLDGGVPIPPMQPCPGPKMQSKPLPFTPYLAPGFPSTLAPTFSEPTLSSLASEPLLMLLLF